MIVKAEGGTWHTGIAITPSFGGGKKKLSRYGSIAAWAERTKLVRRETSSGGAKGRSAASKGGGVKPLLTFWRASR